MTKLKSYYNNLLDKNLYSKILRSIANCNAKVLIKLIFNLMDILLMGVLL